MLHPHVSSLTASDWTSTEYCVGVTWLLPLSSACYFIWWLTDKKQTSTFVIIIKSRCTLILHDSLQLARTPLNMLTLCMYWRYHTCCGTATTCTLHKVFWFIIGKDKCSNVLVSLEIVPACMIVGPWNWCNSMKFSHHWCNVMCVWCDVSKCPGQISDPVSSILIYYRLLMK